MRSVLILLLRLAGIAAGLWSFILLLFTFLAAFEPTFVLLTSLVFGFAWGCGFLAKQLQEGAPGHWPAIAVATLLGGAIGGAGLRLLLGSAFPLEALVAPLRAIWILARP